MVNFLAETDLFIISKLGAVHCTVILAVEDLETQNRAVSALVLLSATT